MDCSNNVRGYSCVSHFLPNPSNRTKALAFTTTVIVGLGVAVATKRIRVFHAVVGLAATGFIAGLALLLQNRKTNQENVPSPVVIKPPVKNNNKIEKNNSPVNDHSPVQPRATVKNITNESVEATFDLLACPVNAKEKFDVRYRDSSDQDRQQIRKLFYDKVYPYLGDEEVQIPHLTSYDGSTIRIKKQDGRIVITYSGLMHRADFQIYQDGTTEYKCPLFTNGKKKFDILIKNEVDLIHDPSLKIQKHKKGEYLFDSYLSEQDDNSYFHWEKQHEADGFTETRVQPFLDAPLAAMELLLFNRDHIVQFLSGGHTELAMGMVRGCLAVFQSLSPKQSDKEASANLELTVGKPADSIMYELGPIWSPVATSQDSTFTFKVTQTGRTTVLESVKRYGGRGHMGGAGSRNIKIAHEDNADDCYTVTIDKKHYNDLEQCSSSSIYEVQITDNGCLRVIPKGYVSNAEFTGWFVKSPSGDWEQVEDASNSRVQAPQQMEDDLEYILGAFVSIKNIYRSPHSLVLDQSDQKFRYLHGGSIVSSSRLRQLLNYQQGKVCLGSIDPDYFSYYAKQLKWEAALVTPALEST